MNRAVASLGLALALAGGCAHGLRPGVSPASEKALTVEGGGGALAVSDGGAGEPAVVLLHGLGGDARTWQAQLDHLRAGGRRAIAYDQRGHGQSAPPRDGVYTVEALADDLGRVLGALGVKRVVLVGHSFSGTVLTAFAAAHPEAVVGLVYVDAIGDFSVLPPAVAVQMQREDAALDRAGVHATFGEMLGPNARPATREQVLAAVDRLDLPAFALLRQSMAHFPGRERFAAYHGPALALEAARFPVLASASFGLERIEVPGASHWLMLDDPKATNAALDGFLSRLPPR